MLRQGAAAGLPLLQSMRGLRSQPRSLPKATLNRTVQRASWSLRSAFLMQPSLPLFPVVHHRGLHRGGNRPRRLAWLSIPSVSTLDVPTSGYSSLRTPTGTGRPTPS